MLQSGSEFTVAVVGAGPRGTSFLERLLAGLEREDGARQVNSKEQGSGPGLKGGPELPSGAEHGACPGQKEFRSPSAGRSPRLRVLVIDPAPHGPGRVWDPEQSPLYLMNTPANFPTAAPAGATVQDLPPSSAARSFLQFSEADPAAYPSRGEYGRYLTAMHQEVVFGLRAQGAVVEELHDEVLRLQPLGQQGEGGHLLTLCSNEDCDGADPTEERRAGQCSPGEASAGAAQVTGSSGEGAASAGEGAVSSPAPFRTRRADAVVLALGHVPAQLNEAGRHFAQAAGELRLHYLPPAIPTEVDLSTVPAGESVLVRGMGLNFFDLMIACTEGRGGEFRTVSGAPAGRRLEYCPSGEEPWLIAGSRRGAPYRAKSELPTHAPGMAPEGMRLVHLTDQAVERALRRHDVLDFSAHLWPLIQRDVLRTYFRTLAGVSPELFGAPPGSLPATPSERFLAELDVLLEDHHLGEQVLAAQGARLLHRYAPEALWFDVRALGRPFEGIAFDSAGQHQQHVLAYLEDDAATSAAGSRSPVKMAVGALHLGRMRLKELIAEARVSQASWAEDVEGWFEPLVEGLASGPPAGRIEELAALARAGVVDFLGPDPVYDVDRETGCFTAESPHVATTEPYRAEVLVEAMMPANRVRLSASALVSGLLRDGLARPAGSLDASGVYRAGKGFDVTAQPHRLIRADGEPSEGVFVLGLQLSSAQWGTAIAAEAGGDLRSSARTLADADAAAQAVLRRTAR